MEKCITWPVNAADLPHACELLRQIVMNLDDWRKSSEARHAALDILEAMDGDPASIIITAQQRELLLQVMVMPGKNINPPNVNRFFLRVLGAAQDATSVERAPVGPT